jgi:two-component system, cell cycle sensor histidine kinase and response regulator CckA
MSGRGPGDGEPQRVDRRTEEELRYRLRFEGLIVRIISEFGKLRSEELDAAFDRALEAVGTFAGVDRAYVFLLRDGGRVADNTHEWCAEGIPRAAARMQGVVLEEALPYFAPRIRRGVFHVPRVAELPEEARRERAEFEAQGIQSLIVVPMSRGGALVGFIGFDAVREPKGWNEDAVTVLHVLADAMTGALDRRRAEEALRQSDQRLRSLFQHLTDIIVVTDAEGRVTFASSSLERVLGHAPEEHLGRSVFETVHPDDLPLVERALREVLQRTNPGTPTEFRGRRADGSYTWLEAVATSLLDDPRVGGVLITARDISERRRAEAERRSLEAQMQQMQRLESLGILAGGIAHDFNNLLTGILGNASLALSTLPSGAPAREHIQFLEHAALRAAELTEQMLACSGKGRFVIEPLDLSAVVREMGNLLGVSISKKCTLHYRLAGGLPAVEGDASQVRQVVMNLLINAAESIGDDGGVITVSTHAEELDSSGLSHYLPTEVVSGRYVILEIADTGCGMSEDVRARMFEPFYTTKFTGRGLGLAAVLGIVRGHGGAIRVASAVGHGSTVRVVLPAARGASVVSVAHGEDSEWRGSGTVLVVDDEEIVRTLSQRVLERAGFCVLTARDGREALESFRAHASEVCLVLLDLTMPRLDGEETFHALKRLRGDVRVLLSSGYCESDATTRFAGVGLAGFVQKPYSVAKLIAAVRRVLEGSR